jgi:hypothetical protein
MYALMHSLKGSSIVYPCMACEDHQQHVGEETLGDCKHRPPSLNWEILAKFLLRCQRERHRRKGYERRSDGRWLPDGGIRVIRYVCFVDRAQ